MTDPRSPLLSEQAAVELLALLVTSALLQLDEERSYGRLRLLVAAERLAEALSGSVSSETQATLDHLMEVLPRLELAGDEDIAAALDELTTRVAGRLVALGGLSQAAPP